MNRFTVVVLILATIAGLVRSQYTSIDKSGCYFPFEYAGKVYDDCIYEDRKFPWCSQTKEYLGIWDYCYDMTKSDWTCDTPCMVEAKDSTGFPSCISNTGRSIYCVDQISTAGIRQGSCPKAYSDISPYHSACLPPLRYVARSGIPPDEIQQIVDMHNNWRRKASPTAAAMQKLYWDERYANVAQKHADRCSFWHDDHSLRKIPETGMEAGQNIVMVTGMRAYNLTHSFDEMFDGESIRWEYGKGVKKEFSDAGKNALHYTQIMLEGMSRFGCGMSYCAYVDRIERTFVCNYNQLQNSEQIVRPYEEGAPCSKCPDKCDNGLCDCGGMECYNGGWLSVNSCKCTCVGLWTGEKCETPIEQKIDDDTSCYNPFLWNGELVYGCMPNGANFICSLVPRYTGLDEDTVYCANANGFKRKKRSVTMMDDDFEDNPDVMVSPTEVNNNKSSSLNHNKHQKPHYNGLFDHKSKLKSNLEMKRQQKGFGSYISHAVFGIKNNNNKNDHSGSKKKSKGKQHAAKSGQTSRFQVKSDD